MKKKYLIIVILIQLYLSTSAITIDVKTMKAKGDGHTLNTTAIQRAIDKCSDLGGGKVIFADGIFVTGTIYLKDNVTVLIEKSAKIIGSLDIKDYPHNSVDFRFYHDNWISRALFHAYKAKNIAIEGKGVIDGRGENFTTKKSIHPYKDRPFLFWFVDCRDITIKGIEMRNAAMWMQLYMGCEKLLIDGIRVYNHVQPNNDMIDICGCKNVIINNMNGDSDDDGITLKTLYRKASENITISNCILSSHCNAIKIGTETLGDFKNIVVNNCVVKPSESKTKVLGLHKGLSGISLESVDGAIIDGISISNLIIDGPAVPLFIRLGNRRNHVPSEEILPETGAIRNIHISDVIAYPSTRIGNVISGIPGHYIEKVSINNFRVICPGGGTKSEAEATLPEKEKSYPEATMFGNLNSYGLYIRHAKDVYLNNISFELKSMDSRPTLYFNDVHNLKVKGMNTEGIEIQDKVKSENCSSIVTEK